jgi:hypothetical protein
MFVMTGMLIMARVLLVIGMLIVASVLLVIGMLVMASVVLVIGVVLVLSYDLTNRSIARVASPIILSAEAVSPATDASWTQWRTCSSSSPRATARNAEEAALTWVRTSMQYVSSEIMRCNPLTWPSILARRFRYSSLFSV